MDIDNNTGLPKGMPNRTPLMDRLRAVTEGAEMALQAKVPLNGIETLLSKPETARKLLAGEKITIPLSTLPGFDLAGFTQSAERAGYRKIEAQARLLMSIIEPWALHQGLKYTSTDTHTLSSLDMHFHLVPSLVGQ